MDPEYWVWYNEYFVSFLLRLLDMSYTSKYYTRLPFGVWVMMWNPGGDASWKQERGKQVTQVVKAYAGGNNEAWAAVLCIIVQYGTVYSTVVPQ